MRTLKKSVGLLLSLIILFGCFTIVPFDAGAQSVVVKTWAELVSAVNSRSAVVLGADITGGESDAFLQIAEGSEIVIDLNGCTLSRGAIGKDDPGYVFKIASNASLTVTDASGNDSGQITGGSSKHGGAFYNQGTLTIEGGSICNNYASDGGAVCNKGTFNMSGGVICNNVSADGGAVYNDVGGVMTLSGTAKLTGNESNSAGGGAVTNYGRCTILDAVALSQNKAFTRGGAVWTGGNSTLALYGGVITQNTAGLAGSGVYYADGTLNMQGAPQVRLNDADDLFLCNGKKITVTGRLVPSFATLGEYPNVGIITPGSDRVITSGYGRYNPDVTNPYNFFFSRDYHELETRDGELYAESFKTTYVFRYWDTAAKKVRVGYDYAENVIDVSTLTDDVSVGMHSGNWYIVRGNVTITHRLNIVGTANLILGDGATLKCTDGIRSERKLNSVLNIYTQAEGTGKLIAETDARDWAAIGGHETGDAGTLNVYGGNIVAKGLRSGIAGGTDIDDDGGAGGPVTIYGGEVCAEVTDGGASGAAIGGGNKAVACWKSGEGIVIYGGTVTAKACYGAGIGNGSGKFSKSSGSIAIYGGKVNAEGETGIGGGNANSNPRIDIYGGEITATGIFGRTAGAGIGAGFNASQGGSINIRGGCVLAVGSSGAGIGGGYKGDGGTVNISGGVVVANAACKGAGIGGGGEGKGGTVNISGGIVHATSTTYDRTGELYKDVEKFFGGFVKISSTKGVVDNYTNAAALLLILGITAIVDYSRDNDVVGAGIGGGSGASSGSITINGGTVNATGGYSGAAIGSGKRGSLDSVTINGGTVNAVFGSFGTGIGGGQYGGGGMVAINGGTVTATNVLNTNGIGAGGNGASTTVTLNWTEDTKDTMSVISYRGYSGTVKLDRPFEDKSSGTVFYRTANADKSKLSGKTLTPFTKLFAGHSLTLNGDIGVNFFLNLTDEQAAKTTVSFRWFNKTHNDVPVEAVEGRPGIYRTSCPVAVAEMTYEITATVTIDNAIQEETDRYKVVSYADVILNDQDFITAYVREHGAQGYERLSTLVKTMLDYGAKAQLRFDRDKNNPANGGEDFFTDPVTIENNADDMTAELEACGLSYVGSSVIYLSQTTLRHYYKITEPDKFTEEVRNGITFDGKAAAYGERDGMIYFDKKDIAAPQLDTEYVIRINGNDYHYAVLDYIARAYNDESASPIEKELAAAVCRYHAAADAYFGN